MWASRGSPRDITQPRRMARDEEGGAAGVSVPTAGADLTRCPSGTSSERMLGCTCTCTSTIHQCSATATTACRVASRFPCSTYSSKIYAYVWGSLMPCLPTLSACALI